MAEIEPLQVVVYEGNADLQMSGGEDEFVALPGNGSTDAAQEGNADPVKGMIFDSEDDAIAFSQRYAQEKGFTITRRTSKTMDEKLQYFTLACNRQGKAQCSRNKLNQNPSTKTQCPAKLNFRLHDTDKFCLTSLILEHNHDLIPSETGINVCRNKIPGVRAKRRRQESSGRSEVCANNVQGGHYENPQFGENECTDNSKEETRLKLCANNAQGGGFENPQLGENECTDNSKEETRLKFSAEDTHVLYQYFFRMQSKNPNFFYAMDFDENSRLRNVFWADARSRAAYESFSDVVKFDAAYLTSKYEVPLASFVGVNHHGEPILLGCGLLSNQNTESFVWLFKSLLACMSYKPPKGLITDQCDEVQDAVEQVFPQTYHSWCLLSVMKKLPEKLRGFSKLKDFRFIFSNVVYESLTKCEFEKGWLEMTSKFGLQGNYWLIQLCINWQKWAPAYIKDTFWAGMAVTKECESEYALFDGYVSSGTKINQFLEQYSKALRDMVEKEKNADFKSSHEVASCITHYDIEKQFQLVYTNKKFEEFQEQLKGKIYCYPKLLKQEGTSYTFNVAQDVKIREQQLTLDFSVWFNGDGCDVKCACRHFEFQGILCCHIISVLTLMKVKEVPSKYVLQRWRKDLERSYTSIACSYDENVSTPIAQRFDVLCKSFYGVAEKAATSDALFESVMDGLAQLKVKVEAQHAIPNPQSGNASSERQDMEI
ncbi:hypothetical protein BDA96_02G030300 [Sorghum bicolor]|uniref:Protein FAR1-RELATED SEQUENCE n=2 Tax=Sorghum bicolor TaxID=4558 RepID=A0A921RKW3_SORBI|nr:protein FAR-RED IMPAIRED RESPONSE 1 [Sorghum bicolor]KAG0541595.1 hypothetical protein BDA96_02G030300 [Sorghum bicolor]KXG34374.1 hypothetical protein SORBI_3002G030400 [Sorghum bicolor]|eukprot:XP_021310203.1 protein FAR-RED IMPAIRED RESPONSE 1 [Sorghum bicolor]